MTKHKPLEALLIDLDGTIADTHGLIFACYCHAVRTHLGKEGSRDIWEQSVGLPLDLLLGRTYAHYGEYLSPETLEAAKQSYRSHMRERDEDVRAFPGVLETLEALKSEGVRLAVVTTKHQAMTIRHLGVIRAAHLFGAVITGDMCARCKPDPEPFAKALEALEVAPDAAAAVGDSAHDIAGGRAAGTRTIAACWGTDNRPQLMAACPDIVCETPESLLSTVRTTRLTQG